jgi:hypothetical protein
VFQRKTCARPFRLAEIEPVGVLFGGESSLLLINHKLISSQDAVKLPAKISTLDEFDNAAKIFQELKLASENAEEAPGCLCEVVKRLIIDKPLKNQHAKSGQRTYRMALSENIEAEVKEIIKQFWQVDVYIDTKKLPVKYQAGPLTLELKGNGGLIQYTYPANPDKPAPHKAGHVLWSLQAESLCLKLRDQELHINAEESDKCHVSALYVDPASESRHVYIKDESDVNSGEKITELHILNGRVCSMKLAVARKEIKQQHEKTKCTWLLFAENGKPAGKRTLRFFGSTQFDKNGYPSNENKLERFLRRVTSRVRRWLQKQGQK